MKNAFRIGTILILIMALSAETLATSFRRFTATNSIDDQKFSISLPPEIELQNTNDSIKEAQIHSQTNFSWHLADYSSDALVKIQVQWRPTDGSLGSYLNEWLFGDRNALHESEAALTVENLKFYQYVGHMPQQQKLYFKNLGHDVPVNMTIHSVKDESVALKIFRWISVGTALTLHEHMLLSQTYVELEKAVRDEFTRVTEAKISKYLSRTNKIASRQERL